MRNKGLIIRRLDADDVRDLFEVRGTLALLLDEFFPNVLAQLRLVKLAALEGMNRYLDDSEQLLLQLLACATPR